MGGDNIGQYAKHETSFEVSCKEAIIIIMFCSLFHIGVRIVGLCLLFSLSFTAIVLGCRNSPSSVATRTSTPVQSQSKASSRHDIVRNVIQQAPGAQRLPVQRERASVRKTAPNYLGKHVLCA